MSDSVQILPIKDKILKSVDSNGKDEILFVLEDGIKYKMYHRQDCCESVEIEDINGDLDDLIDSPLVMAEEVSNHEDNENRFESITWTFYKLATVKGTVVIRWLGVSNGYYSESVDFELIK